MTQYELTFLTDKEEEAKTVQSLLESSSGKILNETKWGKILTAYPIKKKNSAYYHTWLIELGSQQVTGFKRKLNFSESLLRYLFLEVDKELKTK